jgi:hypothetical protein
MLFTLAATMSIVAVALANTPDFPTCPRRMTTAEIDHHQHKQRYNSSPEELVVGKHDIEGTEFNTAIGRKGLGGLDIVSFVGFC